MNRILSPALLLGLLALLLAAAPPASAQQHVQLSQSDLPYKANQGDSITFIGDTIRIAQGTPVYVDNHDEKYNIVLVDRVDDVFIDLSDVVFLINTNGGPDSRFESGIVITGANGDPADNITVTNGKIVRDIGPGEESGYESHGITIFIARNITVKDVDITIDGYNGKCVHQIRTFANCQFIGGTWTNNSNSFRDRQYFDAVAYQGGNSFEEITDTGTYHQVFDGVTVTLTPHAAFALGRTKTLIRNCTLHVDAQNVKYDTLPCYETGSCDVGRSADNPYVIKISGGHAGTKVHDNVITTGTEHQGGRGILLENCNGTAEQPILVYNNDVTASNGPSGENRDGWSRVCRVRAIDGGTTDYVKVYNNIFRCIVDNDPATTAYGRRGVAMAFGIGGSGPDHLWVENNTIICSTLTTGTFEANAAEYAVSDVIPVACTIRYNHYRGGNNIVYFGDAYNGFSGHDLTLEGDTLSFISTGGEGVTWYVGEDWGTADDIVARDCIFLNGASETDIEYRGAGGDVTFQKTLKVRGIGNNGLLVPDAQVTAVNGYGQTVLNSTTVGGTAETLASYRYESSGADSTNFNPFQITLTRSGETIDTTVTLDDKTRYIDIQLSTAGSIDPGADPVENISGFYGTSPLTDLNDSETDQIVFGFTSGSVAADSIVYCYSASGFVDSANATRTALSFQSNSNYEEIIQADVNEPGPLHISIWTKRGDGSTAEWTQRGEFQVMVADDVAPAFIDSLRVEPGSEQGSIDIYWQSPGDDGNSGTATNYEIRYSPSVLNQSNWASAPTMVGAPAPGLPGTSDSTEISGLVGGQVYYVGIKAFDEAGNESPLAVTSGYARGIKAPVVSLDSIILDEPNGNATVYANPVESYYPSLVYEFEIDQSEFFPDPTTVDGSPSGQHIEATFFNLQSGIVYHWRSRAGNDTRTELSPWSPSRSFTLTDGYLNSAPGAPAIVSPTGGEEVTTTRPPLTVLNAEDPDGDALTYVFEVYVELGSPPVAVGTNVAEGPQGTTSWQVPAGVLQDSQNYIWRAAASDGEFVSDYTDTAGFVVFDLTTGEPDDEEVYAYPNPFSFTDDGGARFLLPNHPVDLLIQTVAGETVLIASEVSGEWFWKGHNGSGNKVSPGVYLWYVNGSTHTGKLVVKP